MVVKAVNGKQGYVNLKTSDIPESDSVHYLTAEEKNKIVKFDIEIEYLRTHTYNKLIHINENIIGQINNNESHTADSSLHVDEELKRKIDELLKKGFKTGRRGPRGEQGPPGPAGTDGGGISGTDTQVLFFDGDNNPAGDAGMTYNKITDTLSVTNLTSSGTITGDTFTDGTASLTGGEFSSLTLNSPIVSGNFTWTGSSTLNMSDDPKIFAIASNTADCFNIVDNLTSVRYFNVETVTGLEKIEFGNTTTNPDYNFLGTGVATFGGPIHLAAGTTSLAPLKLTAGPLLATPSSGSIEYYGNKTYITNKDLQKVIDRTSNVKLTTTTVANTTDETEVYEASVPANSWVAGNVLKMLTSGTLSNKVGSSGHTVTVKVYVGTTEAATITSTEAKFTDVCWHISGYNIVRDIGSTGHMAYHLEMTIDGDNSNVTCNVVEIDTTGSLDITVTATWASADDANIFTCNMGLMEYKN